jgi:hypothetical protein
MSWYTKGTPMDSLMVCIEVILLALPDGADAHSVDFDIRAEAQAWCEGCVAELTARGHV